MKLRNVMTVMALGASMPALADNVDVILSDFAYKDGGVKTATITNKTQTGNPAENKTIAVYAGAYAGTLNGASFVTFCTDVYQSLSFGTPAVTYDRLSVDDTKKLWGGDSSQGTTYNPNSYGLVSKLFTTAYTSVKDSVTSAAFQYALWELLYEKTGSYTIDGGNFTVTYTDAGAISKANSWLASVVEANASEGYVVQSLFNGDYNPWTSGTQDLVIATPVPEPQTYALALVSLGIVAGYARRRRGKT